MTNYSETLSVTVGAEAEVADSGATRVEWPQGQPLFEAHVQTVADSLSGNGIVADDDFKVTATSNAREIRIDGGDAFHDGTTYSATAATKTLSSGDATYDRWDSVVFETNSSSIKVREGTAEQYPEAPIPTKSQLLLATIYVPSGASDVPDSNILNWRTHSSDADNTYVKDSAGNYASDTVEGALEEAASAGVNNERVIADEAGAVSNGNAAVIHLTSVPDGGTLEFTQCYLTLADGQPAPSGCDLIIATLANDGTGTSQTTLISGDGATVYDDQTGSPVGSYSNASGSAQTVALMVDNGNFNAGSGSDQDVAAGGIGEVK